MTQSILRSARRIAAIAAAACGALFVAASPAMAQMKDGADAPPIDMKVAQGGAVSDFSLKSALAKGPVVVYFFPKSFTSGCTAEAHDFAEHIADFKKLHATVVGISGDDIDTQKKFSTNECASKFLVGSDPGLKIAKTYDAVIMNAFANRTSYVIAPDGKIAYAYTSLDAEKHVGNTLAALRALVK